MRSIKFLLVSLFIFGLYGLSYSDSSCSGKCTTAAVIDTSTAFGKAITNAWLMNENVGITINSLGTTNNGTLAVCGGSAVPQWTTNDGGKPAIDSYTYGSCITLASEVSLTGEFTIVFRVYPNFISSSGSGILTGASGSGAYPATFDATTFYISSGSYSTITYAIGLSAWKQIIIKRDADNLVTLYENGTSQGTVTRTGTIPLDSIFAYSTGVGYYYGLMDYLVIANGYTASPSDVTAINSNVYQYFCETSCGGAAPIVRHKSRLQ